MTSPDQKSNAVAWIFSISPSSTEDDQYQPAKLSLLILEPQPKPAAGRKILSEAYNSEDKAEFYTFVRSLDAAKIALKGSNKTLILGSDSPLAEIFYNAE